ncbi:MAG: ABC transporter substrate-binding protein, partial [Acutalibacteraceae bacterium]
MNHIKSAAGKALIFAVCAAIVLVGGSCGQNSVFTPTQTTTVITAATTQSSSSLGTGELYLNFSSSDSLNPFEAKTLGNQQLSSLIFDPLVRLDPSLNPELKLAEKIVTDGKNVTITLRNAVFSDGDDVTAEDVVYSLKCAKSASNKLYSDQLKIITGYNADSYRTVSLTLSHADPLIANVLDFPIIKQGSTNRKNDDDKALPPLGCGRYVYSDNSGTCVLSGNKNYYGEVPQNKILLNNTPDSEALQYSIKAGEVDIYYSGVMTGNLLSMSGKTGLVKQPNIVFLGANQFGTLKNKYLRRAVSAAIDRKEICTTAYYNYSEPAKSLYSGNMSVIKDSAELFSETADSKSVADFMKKAGYKNKDSDGRYVSPGGSHITLRLVYNSDNSYQTSAAKLLQKQLEAQGIDIALDGRGYNNYINCVLGYDYDLYLGEIKLNKNFDYSSMMSGKVVANKTLAATTTTAPPTSP